MEQQKTEAPSLPLSIAVDGPVGAGKSSIADAVAHRLNILHLDTGAMYRAIALSVFRGGLPPQDEEAVTALCKTTLADIDILFEEGRQKTLLKGEDVSTAIRTQEIGSIASGISRYPGIRSGLVQLQREIASRQSMIVDGRDIGTVVLPHARVKIYLTASAKVRAQRRLAQLKGSGEDVSYEKILTELLRRDHQDATRTLHPLRRADDAVLVDSTHLSFDETVEAILAIVREVCGDAFDA